MEVVEGAPAGALVSASQEAVLVSRAGAGRVEDTPAVKVEAIRETMGASNSTPQCDGNRHCRFRKRYALEPAMKNPILISKSIT